MSIQERRAEEGGQHTDGELRRHEGHNRPLQSYTYLPRYILYTRIYIVRYLYIVSVHQRFLLRCTGSLNDSALCCNSRPKHPSARPERVTVRPAELHHTTNLDVGHSRHDSSQVRRVVARQSKGPLHSPLAGITRPADLAIGRSYANRT